MACCQFASKDAIQPSRIVQLRAMSRSNDPGSVGAKCELTRSHISLLRSLLNHIEPLGYKYFVPPGRRPFSQMLCYHLKQQNRNGALPAREVDSRSVFAVSLSRWQWLLLI